MAMKNFYANSEETGFTSRFFTPQSGENKKAQLACPFFTFYKPIQELINKDYEVSLLVKLCTATYPDELQKAIDDNVSVRYYTADEFHAKFYIIGERALVGSANLTQNGLTKNREASVVFEQGEDDRFEMLVKLFDELWKNENVKTLNQSLLDKFKAARSAFKEKQRQRSSDKENIEFRTMLKNEGVPTSSPPTINKEESRTTKKEELVPESFRRMYEELIRNYQEIEGIYKSTNRRHSDFEKVGADLRTEIFFFLGWIRIEFVSDEAWAEKESFKILNKERQQSKILNLTEEFFVHNPYDLRDLSNPKDGSERHNKIKENFSSEEKINSLSHDELFEILSCCHAFSGQFRRVSGGKGGLKKNFCEKNTLEKVRKTISYLLHDQQDDIALRVYNCTNKDKYKLERFGPASVMELVGWTDSKTLPVNSRVVKSMRFFGFDVHEAEKYLGL